MAPDRNDPFRGARYAVELGSIKQAGFSEATIPDSTQDPIEYREGNEPNTVRKIPGLTKYGNITLKWGITTSTDIYEWRKKVEDGKIKDARQNIAISLQDDEGNEAARWEFSNAWPTKYDAPDLNATGSDIAIETLEICHEGMVRTK